MTGKIEPFGQVLFCRNGVRESFIEIVSKLDLKPPVVIKPNWSTSVIFTEAEILDWTLSAIDCETLVVESYAVYRSPILKNHTGPFNAELEKRLSAQKKKDLRANDSWFLEFTGIGNILRKHDVEYLNLSEDYWSKRVCDPNQIRGLVESRFDPLVNDIMHSMVPTRLFEMKGGTLLSLAKPKIAHGTIGVTLTIKNLFGMIPTPYRGRFHGESDRLLNDSIVDINKICHSLFDVRGVTEAIFSTSISGGDLLKSEIYRGLGFIWGSNDTMELDSMVTAQLCLNPEDIGHLSLAAKTFGQWSRQSVELGKKNIIEFK